MFKFPREHGITSIWLSTLTYSILQIKTLNIFLTFAFLGSALSLLLADYLLICYTNKRFKRCLPGTLLIALIYSPIIASRFQQLIIPLITLLALLLLFIYLTKEGKPISHLSTAIGGGLVSIHAVFILVSGGVMGVWIYLFPILYSVTATLQASLRVIGYQRNITLMLYSLLAILLLYGGIFYFYANPYSLYIITIDVLSRVVQDASKFSTGISIKAYGLMEFFRTLIVLSLIGITLSIS